MFQVLGLAKNGVKNRELVLAIFFFVLLGSLFLAKNTSPHKRDF